MRQKKSSKVLDELLNRSEYLVVQGNDLAKALGNLKAFEHKILDYCFSYVKKDSLPAERFTLNIADLLKYLGLTSSGTNYERVVRAFKALNENTALYLPIEEGDVKGIMMTQLFGYINYFETGVVHFEFSKYAQPYVFDLKKNYYSFYLRELANVKGKYALILLKLWEAHRYGDSRITLINGDLEEWQSWFLGEEKRLTAGKFMQNIIKRAAEELESKFNIEIVLDVHKNKRNVVGYEMEIIDNRQHIISTKDMRKSQKTLETSVSEEFLNAMNLWED
ncbi:replication initiation protein [Streptococcus anginosus]|jgi:plasmid replication initiation protein|uniref:Replication initiation protein n=2 Tax=Streptococcus anginosus TaxID=1328 RepID=A0A2T0FYB1_STRAP|nr:replication initiation protein [Streptococcus anginosus]PRT68804.1 replication initiation protein [Streptococcus anginosus]UGQ08763.1 RepB family plasmid replication initiator protein [Streptococcus anginosus]BBC53688.1 RepB family plasmid replication initiator protein [Streptococcus anginosus subsp. anginosus]